MTPNERLLLRAINCEQSAASLTIARCSRDVIAATYHDAAEAWRALGRYAFARRNDRCAEAYGWRA